MSCGVAEQEQVLLTVTQLINVTIFVVLFVAFCVINAILHGSTVSHEGIRTIFVLYSDYSSSLQNSCRNKYQCVSSRASKFVMFHQMYTFV